MEHVVSNLEQIEVFNVYIRIKVSQWWIDILILCCIYVHSTLFNDTVMFMCVLSVFFMGLLWGKMNNWTRVTINSSYWEETLLNKLKWIKFYIFKTPRNINYVIHFCWKIFFFAWTNGYIIIVSMIIEKSLVLEGILPIDCITEFKDVQFSSVYLSRRFHKLSTI